MLNRSMRPSQLEGCRPFPVASLEIMLLEEAQRRAREREVELFERLCCIFDWKLTRQQRRYYLKSLNGGLTLVLTDLSKSILWTSHNFLTLTGYTNAEVMSQTLGFLRGTDTNEQILRRANERLKQAKSIGLTIRNRRKNGESYLCRIAIDPLRNSQGETTHFLAVEQEIKEVLN